MCAEITEFGVYLEVSSTDIFYQCFSSCTFVTDTCFGHTWTRSWGQCLRCGSPCLADVWDIWEINHKWQGHLFSLSPLTCLSNPRCPEPQSCTQSASDLCKHRGSDKGCLERCSLWGLMFRCQFITTSMRFYL